ncbi:MAG: hypothetical protein [Podoviridae sp. ctpVR23]|nr:MAG: hypothetical protein [Podoviridae sp. ctpVR23]
MTLTKLVLCWNRDINDFEFCGLHMFQADNDDHASKICGQDGRYVEWDMVEDNAEEAIGYLNRAGDDAAMNLVDQIKQNMVRGATFIRLRSSGRTVQLWMLM